MLILNQRGGNPKRFYIDSATDGSKIALGRKGTLLGLVDSPYK